MHMVYSKQAQYQAYNIATQTVGKTRQIVMLYDGAVRYLRQAIEALRAGRIEERYHLLMKAVAVIGGLQSCIDLSVGSDISLMLYDYYASIERRLMSVHHTGNVQTCETIISELKAMRDVWDEIDQGQSAAANAPASESPF